jgi:hypothetical protein
MQKKYQVRAEGTYKKGRIITYKIPIFGEQEKWWTPNPSDFSKVKKDTRIGFMRTLCSTIANSQVKS